MTQDATSAALNHVLKVTGASHLQHIDSQLSGKAGSSVLKIFFICIVFLVIYYLYIFGSIDSVRKAAIFEKNSIIDDSIKILID